LNGPARRGQTPKVIAVVLPAAHQLAGFADRISRCSRPEDTPIEQPTRFEMVVNLKTALALGLIGPVSILLQADEVIE
jgi:putative tryptophan/tyrosine transport system substrate-binding protein